MYTILKVGSLGLSELMLKPLDHYVAKRPDLGADRFVKGAKDWMAPTGTHIYGMPVASSADGLMADSEALMKSGIDPSQFVAIKTWSDLVNICKKLTRKDGNRLVRAALTPNDWHMGQFISYLFSNGGEFFTDGKPMINTPNGIEALQFMVDLRHEHSVAYAAGDPITHIANGKAVITEGGFYISRYINKTAKREIALVAAPYPSGPRGSRPIATTSVNMYAIPRGAKNPDGGWDFIAMLASLEGVKQKFSFWSDSPARKDFYTSKTWADELVKSPERKSWIELLEYAKSYPVNPLTWNDMSPEIFPFITKALERKIAPYAALDSAAKRIAVLVSRLRQ